MDKSEYERNRERAVYLTVLYVGLVLNPNQPVVRVLITVVFVLAWVCIIRSVVQKKRAKKWVAEMMEIQKNHNG